MGHSGSQINSTGERPADKRRCAKCWSVESRSSVEVSIIRDNEWPATASSDFPQLGFCFFFGGLFFFLFLLFLALFSDFIKPFNPSERGGNTIQTKLSVLQNLWSALKKHEEIASKLMNDFDMQKYRDVTAKYFDSCGKVSAIYDPYWTNSFALKNVIADAQMRYDKAEARLKAFPDTPGYTTELRSVAFAQATTDADGRFTSKIPSKGKFAIFAQAKRLAGALDEHYTWFCWIPESTNVQGTFLMGNNNIYSGDALHDVVVPQSP